MDVCLLLRFMLTDMGYGDDTIAIIASFIGPSTSGASENCLIYRQAGGEMTLMRIEKIVTV